MPDNERFWVWANGRPSTLTSYVLDDITAAVLRFASAGHVERPICVVADSDVRRFTTEIAASETVVENGDT